MNIENYIDNQIEWSKKTFGNGRRTIGILKHIMSELNEVADNPDDLEEWIDVIILAIDGAWRHGYTAKNIIECLEKKQAINFRRKYNRVNEDEPSFHEK